MVAASLAYSFPLGLPYAFPLRMVENTSRLYAQFWTQTPELGPSTDIRPQILDLFSPSFSFSAFRFA